MTVSPSSLSFLQISPVGCLTIALCMLLIGSSSAQAYLCPSTPRRRPRKTRPTSAVSSLLASTKLRSPLVRPTLMCWVTWWPRANRGGLRVNQWDRAIGCVCGRGYLAATSDHMTVFSSSPFSTVAAEDRPARKRMESLRRRSVMGRRPLRPLAGT